MDERVNRVAALANVSAYDDKGTREYIDGAPHIKHASLRTLYANLVVRVYDFAKEQKAVPSVLDQGAGEGSVTLPFLELGARVTAVDISSSQLNALRSRCDRFGDRLEVRCEDIANTFVVKSDNYDIIVASSFLHHIPDYTGMIKKAIRLLTARGQFFSFQDPLRYDSIGKFNMMVSTLSYFSWRLHKGDVVGGLKRRLRRRRGIYVEDSMYDNAEYHVTRNGVDQDAIFRLFREHGFDCRIIRYFSTQSRFFQPIGTALNAENTFAVIARRGMNE